MLIEKRGSRRLMNQINVVPYIDVMLVLLVIFMLTAPSAVMCGVTSRVSAASTNSVLVPSAEVVW